MWRLGKQAFVGRRKYDSPKNDCVGGYCRMCGILLSAYHGLLVTIID